MIQARIQLDQRYKTKKGFAIKIFVSGDGKTKLISTGYFSELKDWKSGPELHRSWYVRRQIDLTKEVDHCNRLGLDLDQSVNVIREGLGSPQEVDALRQRLAQLSGGFSFFEFWERYTEEIKAAGKSVTALDDTIAQLRQFTGDIYITDVTYEFLKSFSRWKYENGCGSAGLSFYLRTMRRVYLEAQRRESLAVPAGNPFRGVIPTAQKKQKANISKEVVFSLEEYTPRSGTTKPNAKRIKQRLDVFLFQILIGGHDLVDVALLTPKDVSNGRVQMRRYKNRNRTADFVDNVLVEKAQEIIDRNMGNTRVFEFIPDPIKEPESYRTWRNHYNRMLRILSEDLEISPGLSTKSPRYLFRTWAGEAGADIIATMQIQGHRATGVTFSYQSRLPNRIADNVLRSVIDN